MIIHNMFPIGLNNSADVNILLSNEVLYLQVGLS